MTIVIANAEIAEGDAIGNDILHEFHVLREIGHEVFFYAEAIDGRYNAYALNTSDLSRVLLDENAVLLYHHGTYWEKGGRILRKAACRIFLKYHNITPEYFFEKFCKEYSINTLKGREQTKRIVREGKVTLYLPDSEYNGRELMDYGAQKHKICVMPPFHKFGNASAEHIEHSPTSRLSDGKVKVLFVGRMAPNKGHRHLIEVIRKYVHLYDREIRLNLVGGLDPRLSLYYEGLRRMIARYGLDDVVFFRDRVDFAELTNYYKAADVFLLMSEHEGFCVPILEAQNHRLPIVALDRCAVKDTIGKEQILFRDADYDTFAAAVRLVARDSAIKSYLAEKGHENCQHYEVERLRDRLIPLFHTTPKRQSIS